MFMGAHERARAYVCVLGAKNQMRIVLEIAHLLQLKWNAKQQIRRNNTFVSLNTFACIEISVIFMFL